MALTDIQLCSRALIKLGATPINSFTDGSAESDVASALYTIVRDALLTSHPWNFATKQAALVAAVTPPVADYQCAFMLPDDFLRAISAGGTARARGAHYRIAGGQLHTDQSSVVLSYIYRTAEADFPPFFQSLLVSRLAAEFCIPLTENNARAEVLARIADEEFKRTRSIDSQQDSPQRLEQFSLIDARG